MELLGGKPLYSNADPHTIIFKVAVEYVFPDMSYMPLAVKLHKNVSVVLTSTLLYETSQTP